MALEDYVYNPLSGTPLDKKVKVKKESDPLSSFAQDQLNQVMPTVSSIVNPVQEIAKKANIELPQSGVIQVESPVLQSQGIPGVDFPNNNLMSMGVKGVDFDLTDDDEIQQIKSLPFQDVLGDLEIYKTTPVSNDIIPTIQDESKGQPLAPLQSSLTGVGSVAGISQPDLATPFSVQKDIDNEKKDINLYTDIIKPGYDKITEVAAIPGKTLKSIPDLLAYGLYELGSGINKASGSIFGDNQEDKTNDTTAENIIKGIGNAVITGIGSSLQQAGTSLDYVAGNSFVDDYQNRIAKSYSNIISDAKKQQELYNAKFVSDQKDLALKYGVNSFDNLSQQGKIELKSIQDIYNKNIEELNSKQIDELSKYAMTEDGQSLLNTIKDVVLLGATVSGVGGGITRMIAGTQSKSIAKLLAGTLQLGLSTSSNPIRPLAEFAIVQGNDYDAILNNNFKGNINTPNQLRLIDIMQNYESADSNEKEIYIKEINKINQENGYIGGQVNRDNIWDYAGDNFRPSSRNVSTLGSKISQGQSQGGLSFLLRQDDKLQSSKTNIKQVQDYENNISGMSSAVQNNKYNDATKYVQDSWNTENDFKSFLATKEGVNNSNILQYTSKVRDGIYDFARRLEEFGSSASNTPELSRDESDKIKSISSNALNRSREAYTDILNKTKNRVSKELAGIEGKEFESGYEKIFLEEVGKSKLLTDITDPLGDGSSTRSISKIVQKYSVLPGVFNTVGGITEGLESVVGEGLYGSKNVYLTSPSYWAGMTRQSELLLSTITEIGVGKATGLFGKGIKSSVGTIARESIEEGTQTFSSSFFLGDSPTPISAQQLGTDVVIGSFMAGATRGNGLIINYLNQQGIKIANADSADLLSKGYTPDQINKATEQKKDMINSTYTSVKKENVGGEYMGTRQKVDLQTYLGKAFKNPYDPNISINDPIDVTPDIMTITINDKLQNDAKTNYSFLQGEYNVYKEGNNTVIVNQADANIKYNINTNDNGNYVIETIPKDKNTPIVRKEFAPYDITINKLDQGVSISETRKKGFDVINKFKSSPSIQNIQFESYKQTGSKKSGKRGLTINLNDGQKELFGYDTIEGILDPKFKGYQPKGPLTFKSEPRQTVDSSIKEVDVKTGNATGKTIQAEVGESVAIYDGDTKIGYVSITDYDINEGKDFNTVNKQSVEYVKKSFNEKIKTRHGGNAENYFVEEDAQQVIEGGKWVKGYYDYTKKRIVLRKDADYTTIIHEVGHAYLDMFVANDEGKGLTKFYEIVEWYNARKSADKQYTKGFKEFQYESNSGNLGEDTKELHEEFARHFEWYTFVVAKKELGDKYPQTILGSLMQEMANFFKLIASYWDRTYKFKAQELTTGVKNIYNDILTISDNKHPDREAIEKAVEMAQEEPGHDALKNNAIAINNMIGNIFGGEKNVYDVLLLTYFNNLAVAGKLKSLDKAVISDTHKRINLGKFIIKSLGYEPIYIANKIQDKLNLGPELSAVWKDTIAQYSDDFAVNEDIIHSSRERLAKYMVDNNISPILFNDLYTIVSEIKQDLALTELLKEDLGQISAVSQVINQAVGVTTIPGTEKYDHRYIINMTQANEHYNKLLDMEQNISQYDNKSQLAIINDLRIYQAYLLINDQTIDTKLKYGLFSIFDYKQYLEFLDGFTYTQRIYMNSALYRYMKENDGKDNRVSFKEYLNSLYDKPGSNSYLSGLYDDLKLKKFSNRKQLLIDRFSDFIQGEEGFKVLKDFFLQKNNPFIDSMNKSLEALLKRQQVKNPTNKLSTISLASSIMNFHNSLTFATSNPTYEELYREAKGVLGTDSMLNFKPTLISFIKTYEANQEAWRPEIELYDDIQGTTSQENMLGYLLSNFLVERLPENTGYVGNQNVLKWAYNYDTMDHNGYMNMEVKIGNKTKKKSDYTFSIPLGEAPTTQYKNSNTITFKRYGDEELNQEGEGKLAYTIPGITITKDEGGTMYVNIDINEKGEFDIPKNNRDIFDAGMEAYFSFLEKNYSKNSYGNVKNKVLTDVIIKNARLIKSDNQLSDRFFSIASKFNKKTKDIIKKYISRTKDYIASLNVSGLIKSASGVYGSKSGIVSFHDGSSEDKISVDNMKTETFWKQAGYILYTYGFIDQQFSDIQTKAVIGAINGISKSKSSKLNGLLKNMISGNNEYELGLKAIEVLKYINADSIISIKTDKDGINLIDDGYTILNVINKLQNVAGDDATLFKSFYNQIAGILGLIKDKDTYTQLNLYLHGYFPDGLSDINENNKDQIADLKIKIEDFQVDIDLLKNRIISKRNKDKSDKKGIKSMQDEIKNLEKEIKDLQNTIVNIQDIKSNKDNNSNKQWSTFMQGYKDNFDNIKNIVGTLNSIGSSINTDVLDKIATNYTDIRSDLNIRNIDDTDMTRNSLYTRMSLGNNLGLNTDDDSEFLNFVMGKNNTLDLINDPTSFAQFTKSNEPGDKVLNLILNSVVFNNEFAQYKGYSQSGYKNAIRVGYSYLFGHGVNTLNGSVSFTDKEYNKDIIEDVDNFINAVEELYKTNKKSARSLIGMIGFKGAGGGEKGTIDFSGLKNAITNLLAKRQEEALESIVNGKNYNLIKFFGSLVKNFKSNNYISNPTELSNATKLANDYLKNNINVVEEGMSLNEAQDRAINKFDKILGSMLDTKFGDDKKTKVKGKKQKDGKTDVFKPFNKNIDSQFLVIHGPANTGKTTLIKSIIDSIPSGGKVSYFVGAKNNITKNVLAKELKIKATTVFDMLYSGTLKNKELRVYTDTTKKNQLDAKAYQDENGNIDFEKIDTKKYPNFTVSTTQKTWNGKILGEEVSESQVNVLIIDEAQGINQDELELFKKLYKKNAIIVLLGDPMQPIVGNKNEYFNSLIKTEDKNSDLTEKNFSILDQINFNKGKDHLDIFLTNFFMRQTNFGKDVGTGKKIPILAGSEYSIENQDAIQFIPLNDVEDQQNISADIIAKATDKKATDKSVADPTDAYLLTYKNETRILMNDLIRAKKFGNDVSDVVDGDIMMYLNSDKEGSKFSVKERFIIKSDPVELTNEEVREYKGLGKILDQLGNNNAKVYLYNKTPHIFVKSETLNYGGFNNSNFPIISYGYALTSDGALGTRAGTVVVYNDFNEGLGGQDTIEKERIYTAITRTKLNGRLYIADADWYVKYGIKSKDNEIAIEDSIVTEFSVKENNISLPMYVRGSIVDKMVQGFGHIIDGIDDLKNEKINLQKMFQTFIQEFSNTIPYNQSSGDQEVEDIHTTFKSFFAPESNIPNILSYDGITTTQVNDIINRYNKIVVDKYNDIKKASIYNNRQDQGEFSSDYLDIYDTDSKELKGSRIYQNVGQDNDKYSLSKIDNITSDKWSPFARRTENIDENLDLLLSAEDYVAIQYEGKEKGNILQRKIKKYIEYLNKVLEDINKQQSVKDILDANKNIYSIRMMFKGQSDIDFNALSKFSWDKDGIKNKIRFMNDLLVDATQVEQPRQEATIKKNKDNYFVKLIDNFKGKNLSDILVADIYDILYTKGELEGDKTSRNKLYSDLNDILYNQYIIKDTNYSDIVIDALGRLFGKQDGIPKVLEANIDEPVESYSFKVNKNESSDAIFEYQKLGGSAKTVIKSIFEKDIGRTYKFFDSDGDPNLILGEVRVGYDSTKANMLIELSKEFQKQERLQKLEELKKIYEKLYPDKTKDEINKIAERELDKDSNDLFKRLTQKTYTKEKLAGKLKKDLFEYTNITINILDQIVTKIGETKIIGLREFIFDDDASKLKSLDSSGFFKKYNNVISINGSDIYFLLSIEKNGDEEYLSIKDINQNNIFNIEIPNEMVDRYYTGKETNPSRRKKAFIKFLTNREPFYTNTKNINPRPYNKVHDLMKRIRETTILYTKVKTENKKIQKDIIQQSKIDAQEKLKRLEENNCNALS